MIIGGVDPGINGGIAFFDTISEKLLVYSIPSYKTEKRKEYDIEKLSEIFIENRPDKCIVEIVHSMPKQGLVSTFFFGKGYGLILGILGALSIPRIDVRPQQWKKYFELSSSYQWKLKKNDGLAEAALLSFYGKNFL
jgi:crossover junction endodeoxyribonuclease RuvC